MSNTTTSPDMDMPVPVVSTDPGPDWATNLNACLSIIDSHDHSTGKGAPITGPIIGSAITGATIDNSVIGGTTPAAATFTQATIGSSGTAFKMQRFTGSLSASQTLNILTYPTSLFGVIGLTTNSGSLTHLYSLGTGFPSVSGASQIYLDVLPSTNAVQLKNGDTAHSNTYDVTVFYL